MVPPRRGRPAHLAGVPPDRRRPRRTPPRADPPEARLAGTLRTLAERIRRCSAPYGAHTPVHRDGGEVLLVRHEGVDLWVLPGGGVDAAETYREAAERELSEEAGLEAVYEGFAMLTRVEIRCAGWDTWGVLPLFAAVPRRPTRLSTTPTTR